MIVTCPACSARFRVPDEKISGKQISLRCARCKKIFPVTETPEKSAETTSLQVLIAHSDKDLCATISDLLRRSSINFQVCHSGEDAWASMISRAPDVALVDVALPGIYGFEMVEKVRANPDLEGVKLILLSSVYNKTAYKRRPQSLYGADDYIEKHHLPDDLVPKVRQLAGHRQPAPVVEEPVSSGDSPKAPPGEDTWADLNEAIKQAEERQVEGGRDEATRSKARRLARIIVSDLALYHEERIEEGVRTGKFFEILAPEIEEARRLFRERFDADAGECEGYLQEAFDQLVKRRRQEKSVSEPEVARGES